MSSASFLKRFKLRYFKKISCVTLSLVFAVALMSCSKGRTAHAPDIIQGDLNQIYHQHETLELTLKDALKIGLENNLDAQIAQADYVIALDDRHLQRLNALPTITAKREFFRRSTPGASTSISAETGTVSLEPSISADQSQLSSLLEANWDVLDSVINIYRSKSSLDQAIIAQERARKVYQNIEMDIESAFWRMLSAQENTVFIDEVLTIVDETLALLDKNEMSGDVSLDEVHDIRKGIVEKAARLKEAKESFLLSELEFKALLSLRPDQDVKLIAEDNWVSNDNLSTPEDDIAEYLNYALLNRPEIQEELLNLQVSKRNLNLAFLETIPGLSTILTFNTNNNSFLEENRWGTITTALTQSVTRLLTLPARYRKAKDDIALADARRRALVAAVISQVYIANSLLDSKVALFESEQSLFDSEERKFDRVKSMKENGLIDRFNALSEVLDYKIARIARERRFIEAKQSYSRLMNSIGKDSEFAPQLFATVTSKNKMRGRL